MSLPVIFDGTNIHTSLQVYEYIVSKRNIQIDPFELTVGMTREFISDVANLEFTLQYAQSIGKEAEYLDAPEDFALEYYQKINKQAISSASSNSSAAEARDFFFNYVREKGYDSFGAVHLEVLSFTSTAQTALDNILSVPNNSGQTKTIEILNAMMLDTFITSPQGYIPFKDWFLHRVDNYGLALAGEQASYGTQNFWDALLNGLIGDELPRVDGMFSNADLLNFEGVSFDLEIDLSSGLLSGAGGANTIDILGAKSVIGSANADVITGSTDQNVIDAREGDDTVFGSLGNDTLDGGEGPNGEIITTDTDTLSYEALIDTGVRVEVLTEGNSAAPTVFGIKDNDNTWIQQAVNFEIQIYTKRADLLEFNALPSDIAGMQFDAGEGGYEIPFEIVDPGTGQARTFLDSLGNPFLFSDLITFESLDRPDDSENPEGGKVGVTVALEESDGSGVLPGFVSADDVYFNVINFQSVIGSAGHDTIQGSAVGNYLIGGAGNDQLLGMAGPDFLYGGAGKDTLYGNTIDVDGSSGDLSDDVEDYLVGGAGFDTYYASHLDSIYDMTLPVFEGIGDGEVYFKGVKLTGGVEVDDADYPIPPGVTLNQPANIAVFRDHDNGLQYRVFNAYEGWEGQTESYYGVAVIHEDSGEYIWITDFNYDPDTHTGTFLGIELKEALVADGTFGDDNITLTNAADTYDAGSGNDTVNGRKGNDHLLGGNGDDVLDGHNDDDILEGGAGADVVKGGNGIDTADYRTSNGSVYVNLATGTAQGGHAWGDTLDKIENLAGSALSDTLIGDSGDNVLSGRAGHDQLTGNGGNDVFDGGAGQDTVRFDWITSGSVVTIDMAAGTYDGAAAGNTYISIENFYGTNIAIAGDTILGDDNKNYLFGVAGDDTLDGRGGGDVLVGGSGADTLTGGTGVDWFFYASTSESGTTAATRDLITDFTRGEDLFDLSLIDANPLAEGNQAFNFFGTNAFSGTAGELRYEHVGGNTIIEGDLDGDQVADFSIELVGLHDLTIFDFGAGSVYPFISGTSADDTLQGGAGDEIIAGGDGDDVLLGGAGNDELYGNGGADQMFGEEGDDLLEGDDAPFGVPAGDLLDGGPGTDEANYYGALAGVLVSLADPSINTGEAAGDTYVSIENLRGSPFDDTLIGDAGDNAIWGEEGDDILEGGGGADALDGGDGFDWASYQSAASAVGVDLGTGTGSGEAAGDTFVSIEGIMGSAHDDTLTGDGSDNVISGGAGADAIDGKGGNDTLSFRFATAAIVVDMAQGLGFGGEATGDIYTSIETVLGSDFDDTMIGGAEMNDFHGEAGDDTFRPGGGGDVIFGGAGSDTLDFSGMGQGIFAMNLQTVQHTYKGSTSAANYVDIGADRIYVYDIENLIGTDFDDIVDGGDANNRIAGGAGYDELFGGNGDDWLTPGAGDDFVPGGNGSDTVDLSDLTTSVYVNLSATVQFNRPGYSNPYTTNYVTAGTETDYLLSIENAVGSNFNDTMVGSGGANTLSGLDGDDTIQGLGGNDILQGGAGNDTLEGGADHDILDGGDGADILDGGAGFNYASYASAASGVSVNLATGAVSGAAAGDTFIAIAGLKGSAFDDTLIGDAGTNEFVGGYGADTIDGGDGRDILFFLDATEAITVDMGVGVGLAGEAAGDSYANIEVVRGSKFDDTIIGGAETTDMFGGDGDDLFRPGGGGDLVVGDGGVDTLDFSWAAEGVVATLTQTVSIPWAGGTAQVNYADIGADRIFIAEMENLIGSDFDDQLEGSNGANTLQGGAGSDSLEGLGGNDRIEGGTGDDALWGGSGADRFVFAVGDGVDSIEDFADGVDLIEFDGLTFA